MNTPELVAVITASAGLVTAITALYHAVRARQATNSSSKPPTA